MLPAKFEEFKQELFNKELNGSKIRYEIHVSDIEPDATLEAVVVADNKSPDTFFVYDKNGVEFEKYGCIVVNKKAEEEEEDEDGLKTLVDDVVKELIAGTLDAKSKSLNKLFDEVSYKEHFYCDLDDFVEHVASMDLLEIAEKEGFTLNEGLEKFEVQSCYEADAEKYRKSNDHFDVNDHFYTAFIDYKGKSIEIKVED